MDSRPPDSAVSTVDESEETFCYAHPKTPTRLRCTRCDRPICGRCAIPASVGQHCPECVAEARRSAPKVRSALRATAPAVMTLIGLNVVAYFAQQVSDDVTLEFAQIPGAVADGEWWRLITPMFLHAPNMFLHIFFNMMVLYLYGPNVEQAFGTVRFLAVYLIAGFMGNVFSYVFGSANQLGVGASGAIFGMVGALAVFLYNRRTSTFIAQYLRGILGFIGINLFLGFVVPQIDNWAHIGGLVAGALLGFAFDRSGRTAAGLQVGAALGTIAVGVAMVMWRTSELNSLF